MPENAIQVDQSVTILLGSGHIGTDFAGIEQLWRFYERAKKYKEQEIFISLDDVTGIDGNLCALIGIILCLLHHENKLKFSISESQVKEKCEVFIANEFLGMIDSSNVKNSRHSVKYKGFELHEKEKFINYLETELLAHEGMEDITDVGKEKIIDDMIELYGNIIKHANAELPFYVCGQYFPEEGVLKFTIADLGQGFFPKIKLVQPDTIKTDIDAIDWAMRGNSTKKDAPGGKGLINIKNYMVSNHGYIQVYSGIGAWQSVKEGDPETIELAQSCTGATINLVFSKNNLILDPSLNYSKKSLSLPIIS